MAIVVYNDSVLANSYLKLANQSITNKKNGVVDKELECKLQLGYSLLLLNRLGFLSSGYPGDSNDLEEWTKKVEDVCGCSLDPDDIANGGDGTGTGGGGSNDNDSSKYMWLPREPVCETEELIWEGHIFICENTDYVT